jgi:NitT/TauT family transport system substrate-binding protein
MSDLIKQYGLPETPFQIFAIDPKYAAAKPENVRAFVRTYEDAVQVLRTNDDVWVERGRQIQNPDAVSALFRDEARLDIMLKFDADAEKNIRKVFDTIFPIAGVDAFGITSLPQRFMTLAYQ